MQYLGGKFRIGKRIAEFLEAIREPGQLYVEPFCGSCWVAIHMSGERLLCDVHPDLIMLWQALQDGWKPPETVSEDLYNEMRLSDTPSALKGFIGFGCSFGGKWFGGYARGSAGRNYAMNAKRSLLKKLIKLGSAGFLCGDCRDWDLSNCLVYCDPPYAGTTSYQNEFDSGCFWNWVRDTSKIATVVVSEYAAPSDFRVVLEIPTRMDIRAKTDGRQDRIEKLFMYDA